MRKSAVIALSLGLFVVGSAPLWHEWAALREAAPLVQAANAAPLALCTLAGLGATSLLAKLSCLVWATGVGGFLRESRSGVVLHIALGLNLIGLALLWR